MTVLNGKVRQFTRLPSRACDGCAEIKPLVAFPIRFAGGRQTLCYLCLGPPVPGCSAAGHQLVEEQPGWHVCLRCGWPVLSARVVEVFRAVALGEIA